MTSDLAIDIDALRPMLRDPLILPSMMSEFAPHYVGTHDARLPGISPVYSGMTGLPPIVLQTACDDPISVDADKIEAALSASGPGTLDHRRFENSWHVFHLQVSMLAEAHEAVADLGSKLNTYVHNRHES